MYILLTNWLINVCCVKSISYFIATLPLRKHLYDRLNDDHEMLKLLFYDNDNQRFLDFNLERKFYLRDMKFIEQRINKQICIIRFRFSHPSKNSVFMF